MENGEMARLIESIRDAYKEYRTKASKKGHGSLEAYRAIEKIGALLDEK